MLHKIIRFFNSIFVDNNFRESMNLKIPEGKQLILFDGCCNLCNNSVQKIIKKDKNRTFLFCAIQSKKGREVIEYLGMDTQLIDSIILYVPGEAYYVKSEAFFNIVAKLGGGYRSLLLLRLLPTSFTDVIYTFVANNRNRWFGKTEHCMVPTTEIKSYFLE